MTDPGRTERVSTLPGAMTDPVPEPGYVLLREHPEVRALGRCIQQRLITLGFLTEPVALADLQHYLPPESQALNAHYTNAVSRAFYTPDPALETAYHALIRRLADDVLPYDFLFQTQPIIRFHFPVPFPAAMRSKEGLPRQIHSDCLGGHPVQMVQVWACLTDCAGGAALQCSTREEGIALLNRYRDRLGPEDPPYADSLNHFYSSWDRIPGFGRAIESACPPIPMRAGELLLFDPRCLHGGAENREVTTRVSLDFRLLPLAYEDDVIREAGTQTAKRFRRGELFHTDSARNLRAG